MNVYCKDEIVLILNVVDEALLELGKHSLDNSKLMEEHMKNTFSAYCRRKEYTYRSIEEMVGIRISDEYPSGVCYLLGVSSYRKEMLEDLGTYFFGLNAAGKEEIRSFLQKAKNSMPKPLPTKGSLVECFKNQSPSECVKDMLTIIERHLYAIKYIAKCAEERDPQAITQEMANEGKMDIYNDIMPFFQLISQQNYSQMTFFAHKMGGDQKQSGNTASLDARNTAKVSAAEPPKNIAERKYPDRKKIEAQDPYYFVLLKCPGCKAGGSSVVRRGDRGYCKCGCNFEIVRNMTDNKEVQEKLKEATSYANEELLKKLNADFSARFDSLSGKLKDMAGQIAGMATSVDYKREKMLLSYEIQSDETRADVKSAMNAIERRIDEAINKICKEQEESIKNLIQEQKQEMELLLRTSQQTVLAVEKSRKEQTAKLDELNESLKAAKKTAEVSYTGILDAIDFIGEGIMQELGTVVSGIDDLKQKIDRQMTQGTKQHEEVMQLLNSFGSQLTRVVGRIDDADEKQIEKFGVIRDSFTSVMDEFGMHMEQRGKLTEEKLNSIIKTLENIKIDIKKGSYKGFCRWCGKHEFVNTDMPGRYQCQCCGKFVNIDSKDELDVRIPTLTLGVEGKDMYYYSSNVQAKDETVVVKIRSDNMSWLNKATNPVILSWNIENKVNAGKLILISDGYCNLTCAAVAKLRNNIISLQEIVIGKGIVVNGTENSDVWRYENESFIKTLNNGTVKNARKGGK